VPSKNSDVQSGDERIGGPAWCPVAFLTVFFFFFIQHRRLVKHASGQGSRVGTVLVTPDGSSWVDVIPASRRSETPAADLRGPRHPWSYSRLIRLACLPRDQSLTMLHQIEGEEFGSQVPRPSGERLPSFPSIFRPSSWSSSLAMKSSPAVSLFGAKAADSAIRRWLSPLLFLAVVALSIFLLYRVATPAVSFPPMTSVRVELSPPVAVWRPVAAAEASDLISSSSLPPVQWPVDAAVASDEEPISSAPSVQNIPVRSSTVVSPG
ncbi:hypothetical protein GW17_00037887, partial [Ensete ventricosum]